MIDDELFLVGLCGVIVGKKLDPVAPRHGKLENLKVKLSKPRLFSHLKYVLKKYIITCFQDESNMTYFYWERP